MAPSARSGTAFVAGGMKILLVDDHALIRDALRGVLRELVEDAIVLEAPDSRQAMRLIEQNPDLNLILLDVAPDRDGFAALAEVRERYPAISIVVLSGQQDRASVVKALDLGALGFIPNCPARGDAQRAPAGDGRRDLYSAGDHRLVALALRQPRRGRVRQGVR